MFKYSTFGDLSSRKKQSSPAKNGAESYSTDFETANTWKTNSYKNWRWRSRQKLIPEKNITQSNMWIVAQPPFLNAIRWTNGEKMWAFWRTPKTILFGCKTYGGFLSHRGTPMHHPFLHGIFPNKNHPAIKGYPQDSGTARSVGTLRLVGRRFYSTENIQILIWMSWPCLTATI